MHKYELTVVVNGKAEDEVRTATIEKVKEQIARFNGTVTNVDDWGKRRLAYEINDRTEGFYYLVNFKADSEFPKELERQYKITEGILRTIVIRKDEE